MKILGYIIMWVWKPRLMWDRLIIKSAIKKIVRATNEPNASYGDIGQYYIEDVVTSNLGEHKEQSFIFSHKLNPPKKVKL